MPTGRGILFGTSGYGEAAAGVGETMRGNPAVEIIMTTASGVRNFILAVLQQKGCRP